MRSIRKLLVPPILISGLAIALPAFAVSSLKYYAIETFTKLCGGGKDGKAATTLDDAHNSLQAWYDQVRDDEKWSGAGFLQSDGVTAEKLYDKSRGYSWAADHLHADLDAHAFALFTHGNTEDDPDDGKCCIPRFLMRPRPEKPEECRARLNQTKFGNGDMRYLHIQACNSMDDDTVRKWRKYWGVDENRTGAGLRIATGFHGYSWSPAEDQWDDFGDDLRDNKVYHAWKDNFYLRSFMRYEMEERDALIDQCPVGVSVGTTSKTAKNRVVKVRYTTEKQKNDIVGSTGNDHQWAASIKGCLPANESEWKENSL